MYSNSNYMDTNTQMDIDEYTSSQYDEITRLTNVFGKLKKGEQVDEKDIEKKLDSVMGKNLFWNECWLCRNFKYNIKEHTPRCMMRVCEDCQCDCFKLYMNQ